MSRNKSKRGSFILNQSSGRPFCICVNPTYIPVAFRNEFIAEEDCLLESHFIMIVDIRIGFADYGYEYFKPKSLTFVHNVTIIKEDNRVSEQIFGIRATVSSKGTAKLETAETGLNYDYTLGGLLGNTYSDLVFRPNVQNITFNFFLNSNDDIISGPGNQFLVTISNLLDFPTFTNAINNTRILIQDSDDCKCALYHLYSHS